MAAALHALFDRRYLTPLLCALAALIATQVALSSAASERQVDVAGVVSTALSGGCAATMIGDLACAP